MEVTVFDKRLTLGMTYISGFTLRGYRFNSPTAFIPGIKVDQRLLDDLKCIGVTTALKLGDLIGPFVLRVDFGNCNDSHPNGQIHLEGSIELVDGLGSFCKTAFGNQTAGADQVKLQVTMGALTQNILLELIPVDSPYTLTMCNPMKPFKLNCLLPNLVPPDSTSTFKRKWISFSLSGSWTTACTVKLVISPGVVANFATMRGLLNDEILSDLKVIAGNGAEIKFHRCFLAAQSPVFERMFQADMQEARTGVLELPDMSEESVRALRGYLYVGDLTAPKENSLVGFELYEAGHKYGIQSLETAMEGILLGLDEDLFSGDVALRLFLFVKDMDRSQLKTKSVKLFKLKCKELKKLPCYLNLFKEDNLAVAIEGLAKP